MESMRPGIVLVELVFWLSLLALVFTYLGYPALMTALARLRPRPVLARAQTPRVDVLLVVHNAAALLEDKLHNLLALDYPADRLRITVVCDGCDDATEAAARRIAGEASPERIRVLAHPQRQGKSACIGSALASLDADLVLFTDVRQRIDTGAVRALAAAFADELVGAASGELVLESAQGYGRGIDAYWRYEKAIRRVESASGSLVGVTGALYAARRAAIGEVPPGIVLDDMWIPLRIAEAGYRVVFVPQALAYDRAAADPATEEARKRRTLSGNYQLLHRWPHLAVPGAHPLAWRLWGHKWLRLLAPWLLLLALLSNAALAATAGRFYLIVFMLQLLAYALALLGRGVPALARAWLPARLAAAFLSLNASALLGLADYLRNPNAHLWRTTPRGVSR
ncbi:cellulose synthase/poly-beta-1,6-N-acetylglucosamine synthase-like glycosyltransferase [Lysobacter niastensis]|uniref:Cellulose synthase/poly-beta-1,6-N-acetylglucosamine synthase-like glycosyltransferase n=1 Tax=Lysobacter niastensis TaxID=380629 RepID=A0ABU1W9S4_9GAMM|nr:glycosyltransferase family 2 protein [Lysobacter niastensis]MDR7134184.1 cellulose synthase/poly-beta-1,6-N-acetylglucosamine synthase-like glycosyltransferase [Lysobacter niastensis]